MGPRAYASSSSPTPSSDTCTNNGELALVKFANGNAEDTTGSPKDMIVHESVKQLLQEVKELKSRCTALEATNAELQATVKDLKHNRESDHASAPMTNGYAPPVVAPQDEHATKIEMEALNTHVDQHVTTVNGILEKFRDYLLAEVSKREELEKQVERLGFNSTGTKGRVGKLEVKIKSLEQEMDELTIQQSKNDQDIFSWSAKDSADNLSAYFEDKMEKLKGMFTLKSFDIEGIQNEVKAQAAAIDELQVIATCNVAENNAVKAKGEEAEKASGAFEKELRKRIFHHEFIDQAPTIGGLYVMFHQLTKLMDVTPGSGKHSEGPFKATPEEAFFLRDRVLCRIALFNGCIKALKEAQAAEVDL